MGSDSYYGESEYQASITLLKAALRFVTVMLGVGAGVLAVEPPATLEEFWQTWPAWVFALVLAVFKAWDNYRKNRDK